MIVHIPEPLVELGFCRFQLGEVDGIGIRRSRRNAMNLLTAHADAVRREYDRADLNPVCLHAILVDGGITYLDFCLRFNGIDRDIVSKFDADGASRCNGLDIAIPFHAKGFTWFHGDGTAVRFIIRALDRNHSCAILLSDCCGVICPDYRLRNLIITSLQCDFRFIACWGGFLRQCVYRIGISICKCAYDIGDFFTFTINPFFYQFHF